MAHPLELSYNWRLPVGVATLAMMGCLLVLAGGRAVGWASVSLIVVAMWAVFVLVMVRRARSYLMVEGSTLVLRPWRAYVRIEGSRVRAVRQVLTPRGPSYRLVVEDADGRLGRHLAPTAWLRGGHSVLFTWLLAYAPQAELDKGSRKTLDLLRTRGLIT
jgi:hypothetical protein